MIRLPFLSFSNIELFFALIRKKDFTGFSKKRKKQVVNGLISHTNVPHPRGIQYSNCVEWFHQRTKILRIVGQTFLPLSPYNNINFIEHFAIPSHQIGPTQSRRRRKENELSFFILTRIIFSCDSSGIRGTRSDRFQ